MRRKTITSEDLRRDFRDTLDKLTTSSAITVYFRDIEGSDRAVVGFPYSLERMPETDEDVLVLGSYAKDFRYAVPRDFLERKMRIRVRDIFGYRRWEISEIDPNPETEIREET